MNFLECLNVVGTKTQTLSPLFMFYIVIFNVIIMIIFSHIFYMDYGISFPFKSGISQLWAQICKIECLWIVSCILLEYDSQGCTIRETGIRLNLLVQYFECVLSWGEKERKKFFFIIIFIFKCRRSRGKCRKAQFTHEINDDKVFKRVQNKSNKKTESCSGSAHRHYY